MTDQNQPEATNPSPPPPTGAEVDLWTRALVNSLGRPRPGQLNLEIVELAKYATAVVEGVRAIKEGEVPFRTWEYVQAVCGDSRTNPKTQE